MLPLPEVCGSVERTSEGLPHTISPAADAEGMIPKKPAMNAIIATTLKWNNERLIVSLYIPVLLSLGLIT